MKKEKIILLLASLAIFALAIVLLAGVYNVSAVDSAVTDAIGVNSESLDNIPRTQEEAGDKASNYLKQEWNKLLTNNKFVGPIHNWSISHPLFFQILFNEPYSFSLVFIWIVILLVNAAMGIVSIRVYRDVDTRIAGVENYQKNFDEAYQKEFRLIVLAN